MKNLKNIFSVFAASALIFSCKPDAYKEIGEPVNNINAITGTWALTKVTQTDIDAQTKGFPFQTQDLTALFPYTDFRVTFNSNNGTPSTFTTTPGNSPRIISIASGNWSADDIDDPKVLTLTSGSNTQRITLGSYPGATSPLLKISVERRDAASDKLLIRYSYEFTKQ